MHVPSVLVLWCGTFSISSFVQHVPVGFVLCHVYVLSSWLVCSRILMNFLLLPEEEERDGEINMDGLGRSSGLGYVDGNMNMAGLGYVDGDMNVFGPGRSP